MEKFFFIEYLSEYGKRNSSRRAEETRTEPEMVIIIELASVSARGAVLHNCKCTAVPPIPVRYSCNDVLKCNRRAGKVHGANHSPLVFYPKNFISLSLGTRKGILWSLLDSIKSN